MRLEKKDAINGELVAKITVPKFEISSGLEVYIANSGTIYIVKNNAVVLTITDGDIIDSDKLI